MKPFRVLALAVAAVLLPVLAACGSTSSSSSDAASPGVTVGAQPTGGADLAGTSWVLAEGPLSAEDLASKGITIEFADGQVSGNSGVNTYFGGYTSSLDGTLAFDPLASTMMAGDEAAMALEQEYLAALQTAFGYSISDGTLTIFGAADQVLTYTAK
ncbi:MAG: META domain-containing protein [Actinomycetota bacterium]|nr:META domain-containing protein [Actinomycetota bacterium]